MADYKRNLYNCAIDGQGYLLSGIPLSPARIMRESSVFGTFPTQVDLEYKDSSQFLPWAQTDFSGGFQFEKWSDNAGFKKGTGLDYIAKYGELTLLNDKSATIKDFGAGFTFGAAVEYDRDTVGLVIGITKASGASELWKISTADSPTAITGGTWANVDAVHDMDELQGLVYIGLTVSAGNPLKTYSGSAVADITLTGALSSSKIIRMVKRIETRLYVGGYTGTAASGDALMYSDDEGSTWTAIVTKLGKNREITHGVDNLGTLYFLIEDGSRTELWWCNDTIITQIYRWENLISPRISAWLGKVYVEGEQDGNLMRFEWNGATLRTMFEEKISGLDLDTSPMVVYKNNLHSYGLVYDGLFHFPSWIFKYTANKIYPFTVFGSSTTQVPYFYGLSGTNLIVTKLDTSAYLTTGNVITGIFNGGKSAVDKLWNSITISFKALTTTLVFSGATSFAEGDTITGDSSGATALLGTKISTTVFIATEITGTFDPDNDDACTTDEAGGGSGTGNLASVTSQTIKAEYSTDDEGSWNEIDTISPTNDETEKTISFANNITSKRIQIRLTLTGAGYDTPTLYDFIVRFLSLTDNRFEWVLRLNCSDNLMLLDGKTVEQKRASELRNLLMTARFDNQIVAFQDVDFAEVLLNETLTAIDTTITVDSTGDFPEQGRIKIELEEILYTGKTATAFTGCTRGVRGTKKSAHADDTVVNNAYNVVITNISEENPVAPKAKTLESNISVALKEV